MTPHSIHTVFDLFAWSAGGLTARYTRRRFPALHAAGAKLGTDFVYTVVLAAGIIAGAWMVGSANLSADGTLRLGHSIAGALFGGVAAVEILKFRRGLRQSTGAGFVLPLALGIGIGRFGCFFAGLDDFTYGVPTTLPWAHDFGDGIPRHPVQLYESAVMLLFAAMWRWQLGRGSERIACLRDVGFYAFVATYAGQRFLWEFLKPYPAVLGPLNLFHFITAALFAYAALMARRAGRAAPRPSFSV